MFTNPLPLTGLTVINHPKHVTIQVELRKVKLDDSIIPSGENAWVYVHVHCDGPPGTAVLNNYLGPIINVQRGVACELQWINTLTGTPAVPAMPGMAAMPAMQVMPPINPPAEHMRMIHDMTMQPPVGVVAHLHGGKVQHDADGWPLDPVGYVGNPYGFPTSRTYRYPNDQRAAMLWFHDHAMDNTAPQVFAGLAGVYFVRDKSDDEIFAAIGGATQEIPLVIQDRVVACGYDAMDYWAGLPSDTTNPAPDGYARPEFLGETIFVNGRATPFHNVSRAIYRLRILNGSNARTYALALIDPAWWAKEPAVSRVWHSDCLRVIGTEAGLMAQSIALGKTDYLLLAPGERVDVLLDLTGADVANVDCLRLVNLAVASARNEPGVEGIFLTDAESVLTPAKDIDTDPSLHGALQLGPANIMQFCIGSSQTAPPLDVAGIDGVLQTYANGDGFRLQAGVLTTEPVGAPIARNRFVLLMNNTRKLSGPNPLTEWKDTQMWELGAPDGVAPPWNLPFSVDTAGANPASGGPAGQTPYGIYRATFFNVDPAPQITPTTCYPDRHKPTYEPVSGTYERWYVANVGNVQPLDDSPVDMHPFHVHLVNFTVLRRWTLDTSGNYVASTPRPLDFDGIARHDTVRVQSCELLELLVYFPPGFTGDFVYHCHLVEHEDMGMMLHFTMV